MISKSLAKIKYSKSALRSPLTTLKDGSVLKVKGADPFKKIKGFEEWFYTGGTLAFGHFKPPPKKH